MNPVGRIYYNASTMTCISNALSQPGGYALGAQAGEAAIRQVVIDAGFTRFRRAAGPGHCCSLHCELASWVSTTQRPPGVGGSDDSPIGG